MSTILQLTTKSDKERDCVLQKLRIILIEISGQTFWTRFVNLFSPWGGGTVNLLTQKMRQSIKTQKIVTAASSFVGKVTFVEQIQWINSNL